MKYEITLQSIIPRTVNVTSFRFIRPEGLNYKPGQFFFVNLQHQGKEIRKHFSFSSSPTEPDYIEFTKKLSDSEYSTVLWGTKPGAGVQIDAPYGKFTFEGEYPKVALLAGGIGITPFRSMIKYAADKSLNSHIALFYGCRTPVDIVFRDEWESTQKNNRLKVVLVVNEATPNWTGRTGVINADLIKQELPDYREYIFFACGPPGMVKAMQILIENLGLPKEQLKLEYFTGYT
ncbi:MAG: FAD-dependent oxidoreductase [Nitrososphaerota archaeon]|jgi:ferredoxin-NADP reductase|nr:FAD-dependent oxidoreductase [Nitrososphaerota archaeon]